MSSHHYILSSPVPTRRIIMREHENAWFIVSDTPVGKITPPSHHKLPKVDRGTAVTGSWFELFDRNGRVLYRRRIELARMNEYFDSKGIAGRQAQPEITLPDLIILIPELEETAGIALFNSPPLTVKEGLSGRRKDLVPIAIFERHTALRPHIDQKAGP